MARRGKDNYYLDIAETVLERGTCLRRNVGAIIVKGDVIVSTGYAGAPRGRANCSDIGTCHRETMGVPRGQRYEVCRSVHAEANAIIAASKEEMQDATLYLAMKDAKTGELEANATCCNMCRRLIINAGIKNVVIRNDRERFTEVLVESWVKEDDTLPEDVMSTYK